MTYTVDTPIIGPATGTLSEALPANSVDDAINVRLTDSEAVPDFPLRHRPRKCSDFIGYLGGQLGCLLETRVFFNRSRLHVVRVDTSSIRAMRTAMIGDHSARKFTEPFFVIGPMGATWLADSRHSPVSITVPMELPFPTTSDGINDVFSSRFRAGLHPRIRRGLRLVSMEFRLAFGALTVATLRPRFQRKGFNWETPRTALAFVCASHAYSS